MKKPFRNPISLTCSPVTRQMLMVTLWYFQSYEFFFKSGKKHKKKNSEYAIMIRNYLDLYKLKVNIFVYLSYL